MITSPFLPWAILAALLVSGAAGFFGYTTGATNERNKIEATAARDAHIAAVATDAAQRGAAQAIAGIQITNTTIRQRLQTEVVDRPVYRDCVNTPAGMSTINSALTGASPTVSLGDSELPGTDPAH